MLRFLLGLGFGLIAARALTAPRPAEDRPIRNAGPEEMRDPPPSWDRVDEQVDESFPASDPPATY